MPVVKELTDLLREQRQTLPEDAFFIFPTKPAKGSAGRFKKGGEEMLNMLDLLKLDYFRAGLNCGTCEVVKQGKPVSCAGVPQCFRAGLHMFRHTYATNHLCAGFSLPDVSRLLGHQDVHTTQVYLHSTTTTNSNGDSVARDRSGTILGRSSQTFNNTRDGSGRLASINSADARLLFRK